jgi:hypothetical protein
MRIPQRRDNAFLGNPGDMAYGIEAVYTLSFLVMFISHVIIILAWSGFSIWWLKHHPGDLQSAFVPLATVLAIEVSFWCLPGLSRDE